MQTDSLLENTVNIHSDRFLGSFPVGIRFSSFPRKTWFYQQITIFFITLNENTSLTDFSPNLGVAIFIGGVQ